MAGRNTIFLVLVGLVALTTIFVNYYFFTGSEDAETVRALTSHNEALQKALKEQKQEILKLRNSLPSKNEQNLEELKKQHQEEINRLKAENDQRLDQVRQLAAGVKLEDSGEQILRAELASAEKRIEDLKKAVASLQAIVGNVGPTPKEQILEQKLQEYTQLHNNITSGKLPPRYIQCVLINGWGNVLQEAVSCFLVALVARRAVIFNTSPLLGYMPFQDFLSGSKLPFDGYNMGHFNPGKELVIPRFNFTCLNYREDYKDYEYITIHLTYDYFATNAIINPHHADELEKILPRNYFQVIFRYLFKLNDNLQAQVDAFKRDHFGKYNVGIQIRNPSKNKKGEVDHKGFPVPPIQLYAEVAEQLTRFQEKAPYQDATWFIATQNLELIQYLQNAYGTKRVTYYNGTITTTFDNHLEGQRVSFVTWWLLGECDEVVTTEASSYGTTAAARTGIVPIVCNHHKYCMRRLTPTPCQDTHWLQDQPQECLTKIARYPHEFLTSPESSCGYYKLSIYQSKEYQEAQAQGK